MSNQLSAKLTADVKGYKKAIEDAKNTLKVFNAEESAAAQTMRKVYDVSQDQVKAYKKVLDSMSRATDGTKTMKQASNLLKNDLERLRLQWANLSDTAKKSNFGKSLANSIRQAESQLKGMQSQVNAVSVATQATNGSMSSLIGVVGKFAPAIGVGATAMKGLKDAFFNSESNIDEWGRTVEAAKGTYQTFLDTLNNGNWSNFFSNVGKAQKEMRNLYDLYDYAGSTNNNNQIAIAQQEKVVAELRKQLAGGADVKKQLKEADAYLRTLKMQGVTADKNAGYQGMVTALGADIPEAVRKSVVDGFMKGGQDFVNYATKRVADLGKVTEYGQTKEITGANGVKQRIKLSEDKYAYSGNQALEWEYKALKALVDKESNAELNKGMQSYLKAINSETQIENQSRKIASAVKEGIKEGQREGLKTDFSSIAASRWDPGEGAKIGVSNKALSSAYDRVAYNSHLAQQQTYNPQEHISAIQSEIGAVQSLGDAWIGVGEAMESSNPVQIFSAIANGVNNSITSVMQLAEASQKASKMQQMANLGAMASSEGKALGEGTASAAGLPFPYNLAAIATVVATIAATFASFSSMIKKPKAFANGGIVSGPTLSLTGEYPGAANNPEVIAPLDKLKGMIADTSKGVSGDVRFEIQGRTLVGILNKESNLNSRR